MANVDNPSGFKASNRLGGPYSGATIRVAIPASDSTAVFIGDAVKLAGSSVGAYPTVAQAAAGDAVFGVVQSFEADPVALENQYRVASTLRYANVIPAEEAYFKVQADDVGSTLAAADVGLNADIVVGAGNTSTGMSGMELDSSTAATTATLVLQIVGFEDRIDNEIGVANQDVIVKFNVSQGAPNRTGV